MAINPETHVIAVMKPENDEKVTFSTEKQELSEDNLYAFLTHVLPNWDDVSMDYDTAPGAATEDQNPADSEL